MTSKLWTRGKKMVLGTVLASAGWWMGGHVVASPDEPPLRVNTKACWLSPSDPYIHVEVQHQGTRSVYVHSSQWHRGGRESPDWKWYVYSVPLGWYHPSTNHVVGVIQPRFVHAAHLPWNTVANHVIDAAQWKLVIETSPFPWPVPVLDRFWRTTRVYDVSMKPTSKTNEFESFVLPRAQDRKINH